MILEHQKGVKKSTKIILGVLLLGLIIAGFFGMKFYSLYFAPNVTDHEKYIYIKTNGSYEGFIKELANKDIIKDLSSFEEAAGKMNLAKNLKPGRYEVKEGMNNRTLINKLKAGNQDAVKLKFQNIRKKENFAAYLAKNMESDSLAFIKVLDSAALVEKYGFTTDNVYTMFIPNTYEFYWNSPAEKVFRKIAKEYVDFWNESRKAKAKKQALSPQEVITIASIVEEESNMNSEKPNIASVYMNRVNKGMRLQADPTARFAYGDFTIKRIKERV